MKIKLVLSIRSLDIGGAERQFIEFVKRIDKSKFSVTVCTMYGGIQEDIIQSITDISYVNLQKKGRYDIVGFFVKYKTLLQKIQPDAIYAFLGEMNLFSLWCKPQKTKIIWGFRASNMNLKHYGFMSQTIFWLQRHFASHADLIISNSNASIVFHKMSGFDMSKAVTIANGINTAHFQKDEKFKMDFRKQHKLSSDNIAIGMVARIDPMKGHKILATAAKKLLAVHSNLYFFCVGDGENQIKQECINILDDYNKNFIWLGSQKNIVSILSGCNIVVSASIFGEGFSNAIAEAMSCQIPCIVTDVGDSAKIVGNTGIIIEPNNVEKLAIALEEMLKKDLEDIGKQSRQKIIDHFSAEVMTKKSEDEILKCVAS